MRKGYTLIEVVVVVVIIAIIAVGIFAVAGSGCGNGMTTSYGRNLRLVSTEYGVAYNTYHYEDVNTGERFYSNQEGGVLYPE